MKYHITAFLFMLLSSLASCRSGFKVVNLPIVWDSTRRALSLEYLEKRHGIKKAEPTIEPRMVVLHWTAIPTLASSFRAFDSPMLPAARANLLTSSALNVSVQFLVDYDGTIYRLMPDTTFARHCIGLNYMAVGVENVGDGSAYPLTKAQVKANVQIVKYLAKKYPLEYLIGHHEYYDFRNTVLWKETDPNYITQKIDPGADFMKAVRKRVKRLRLKSKSINLPNGGDW
ncbi:MAG: peptidoglycan recognition family protein [Siphonobacter sp.]